MQERVYEKIIDEINHLDLFNNAENQRLIDKLRKKEKGRVVVECLIRKTDIVMTPEEIVRKLYLDKLINEYKYSPSRPSRQGEAKNSLRLPSGICGY